MCHTLWVSGCSTLAPMEAASRRKGTRKGGKALSRPSGQLLYKGETPRRHGTLQAHTGASPRQAGAGAGKARERSAARRSRAHSRRRAAHRACLWAGEGGARASNLRGGIVVKKHLAQTLFLHLTIVDPIFVCERAALYPPHLCRANHQRH